MLTVTAEQLEKFESTLPGYELNQIAMALCQMRGTTLTQVMMSVGITPTYGRHILLGDRPRQTEALQRIKAAIKQIAQESIVEDGLPPSEAVPLPGA